MGRLTVLRPGPLTTVQDLGRTQHRHEGVSLGGALDRHAARVANLLVGNQETDALLEFSHGRARFRFSDPRLLAWCGGEFDVGTGRGPLPAGHCCRVGAGEEIAVQPAGRGYRGWLAISGGIDVPLVLGSRATDLRAQFGGWHGRPLTENDELPLGQASEIPDDAARVSSWSVTREWSQPTMEKPILRLVPGAEWNEFGPQSRDTFFGQRFKVSPKCDRMGLRLEGDALQRKKPNEHLSAPVAPGTIQLPNDGQPIILLGDCQTIGGYPKIAHVITVDLARAAQLRPGNDVFFQEVAPDEAVALSLERERELQCFRVGLALRRG